MIRIQEVLVENRSENHQDLLNDDELVGQIIIGHQVFLQTVPVARNPREAYWRLNIDCHLDVVSFSLAILRTRMESTRLLGYVDLFPQTITVAMGDKQALMHVADLHKVTPDGPVILLAAMLTSSSDVRTSRSQTKEDSDYSLRPSSVPLILSRMNATLDSGKEVDRLDLFMQYERTLLLPDNDSKKVLYLEQLGRISENYESQTAEDLSRSIDVYQDAVRCCQNDELERAKHLSNLARTLLYRVRHLGRPKDVYESIIASQQSADLTPANHPDKPDRLHIVIDTRWSLYHLSGKVEDLEQVILSVREALRYVPHQHDKRSLFLFNLGSLIRRRFDRLGSLEDLDESITLLRRAFPIFPLSHPSYLDLCDRLCDALRTRFRQSNSPEDIEESIAVAQHAVDTIPDNHPRKADLLTELGVSLMHLYLSFGDTETLNQSILAREKACQLTPGTSSHKPAMLNNLGTAISRRFERFGRLEDLDRSLEVKLKAVELAPDDHPNKAAMLSNLANSFTQRHKRLGGGGNDLNQSIVMLERALKLMPGPDRDKVPPWHNLGGVLLLRYQQNGDLEDLEKSIAMTQKAIDNGPSPAISQCFLSSQMSRALLERFKRRDDLDSLTQGIAAAEMAVETSWDDHPELPLFLSVLASSLSNRFERLGGIEDLERCIELHRRAVQLAPDDDPSKSAWLGDFGTALVCYYDHCGRLEYLSESLVMQHQAVDLTPDDDPSKASTLHGLASTTLKRFDQLGDINDLTQSIIHLRRALEIAKSKERSRSTKAVILYTLGNALYSRYLRLGAVQDLQEAVAVKRESLELTPDAHPDLAMRLHSLGNMMLSVFYVSRKDSDLDDTILYFKQALELTPDGHPDKAIRLNSLGLAFHARFGHLKKLSDLDDSISTFEEVLQLTPSDHVFKASWTCNLGSAVLSRFDHLHEKSDGQRALSVFTSAALSSTGAVFHRFKGASLWTSLTEELQHPSQMEAFSTALAILPQLAWPGLSISDRHFSIERSGPAGYFGRRAFAVALQNGFPGKAIEWLEQAHSIVWGQFLNLRTPLDDLRAAHPALCCLLEELSSQLELSATRSSSRPTPGDTLPSLPLDSLKITQDREELIESIRKLPGFQSFLLPRSLGELSKAASLGPVVILNQTLLRCDALVLLPDCPDNVLHVPLTDITQQQLSLIHDVLSQVVSGRFKGAVKGSSREEDAVMERLGVVLVGTGDAQQGLSHNEMLEEVFRQILLVLWNGIVKPVVEALALSTSHRCRVWWCPTGPSSFLPLHAAGDYSPNAELGSKLSDYAYLSYIPSVTSLLQVLDSRSKLPEEVHILAIAQSSSKEFRPLPGARKEVEALAKQAPVKLTQLINSEATVERVKNEMIDANWVHFACHGVQRLDEPTQSALILAGESRLTLSEIISMRLTPKHFAFLSACQTATGDTKLSDEAVHLAAGMLTAGFCGVVGTMWSISDEHAPSVANDVYSRLFQGEKPDATQAAIALHDAVENLRKDEKKAVSFRDWVPFIHFGL